MLDDINTCVRIKYSSFRYMPIRVPSPILYYHLHFLLDDLDDTSPSRIKNSLSNHEIMKTEELKEKGKKYMDVTNGIKNDMRMSWIQC